MSEPLSVVHYDLPRPLKGIRRRLVRMLAGDYGVVLNVDVNVGKIRPGMVDFDALDDDELILDNVRIKYFQAFS